ncbi:MAG: MlaD family protein [Bdellovibrionaceae bacterium]|nr:MlaD family protein [Pseudobdellovibrionaceae bacterium]
MENASTRLQFKVGVFVAIGLCVLMGSILVLGGNRVVFTRYLHVRAQFSQVQGLFPGSVVSLAGLPIGNVKKIDFVPSQNKLEVEMQIDRAFSNRVHQGTTAEIRTQGALGDKFVYLTPGPADAPAVSENTQLTAIDEGDFLKMITSKEDGIGQVFDLIKEMRMLVASLNQNNKVGATVEQMRSTMQSLDRLVGELRDQLPENKKLRMAVNSMASIMDKIDSGKGTLGALVNDPSLHQNLKSVLGGSQRGRYIKEMARESIQTVDKK